MGPEGHSIGLQVGPKVEPLPSGRRPERVPLVGSEVRLEPVDADAHAPSLWRASHRRPEDVVIWTYLSYGPFESETALAAWLEQRARSADPLFFAVVEQASGAAAGMASWPNIVPANGTIEIGHIWFAPALQRTPRRRPRRFFSWRATRSRSSAIAASNGSAMR